MTTRKLLRGCFAAMLFLLPAVGAHAQVPAPLPSPEISAEKRALIKEMLELTNSKKTMDAMLKMEAEQMEKQLPEATWLAVSGMQELKSLTPQQREGVRQQVVAQSLRSGRRLYELVLEKLDFDKLIEDISLPLYDKYFSESELRDILTFHKSATGKKVIEVLPNLMTEAITRATNIMLPKITEIVSQIMDEEKQRASQEVQAAVKTISSKPAPRTPKKRKPR